MNNYTWEPKQHLQLALILCSMKVTKIKSLSNDIINLDSQIQYNANRKIISNLGSETKLAVDPIESFVAMFEAVAVSSVKATNTVWLVIVHEVGATIAVVGWTEGTEEYVIVSMFGSIIACNDDSFVIKYTSASMLNDASVKLTTTKIPFTPLWKFKAPSVVSWPYIITV